MDIVNWQSDVAKQYNLRAIPYFEVYDTKGEVLHQGAEALKYLDRLEQKAAKKRKKKADRG